MKRGHEALRTIGAIAALNRYPVKSMAGEALAEADLRWSGVRGDREYAFVFADRLRRFPWLSARDVADLVTYRARAAGPYAPSGLPVEVDTPTGARLRVDDQDLAAELSLAAAAEVHPLQISRGAYDSMPVSVVSTSTFAAVDAAHGTPVDPARFRINIVIDSDERDTAWRGAVVEIGDGGARLAIVRPIERCSLITIDPASGRRNPTIMRTVAQKFGNEVGELATILQPGVVRCGDLVRLVGFHAAASDYVVARAAT